MLTKWLIIKLWTRKQVVYVVLRRYRSIETYVNQKRWRHKQTIYNKHIMVVKGIIIIIYFVVFLDTLLYIYNFCIINGEWFFSHNIVIAGLNCNSILTYKDPCWLIPVFLTFIFSPGWEFPVLLLLSTHDFFFKTVNNLFNIVFQ